MVKYRQLPLDDQLSIEAGFKEGSSFRTIDMPRKVRMHPRRKSPDTEKVDLRCREWRAPEDFKVFMAENPGSLAVELDPPECLPAFRHLFCYRSAKDEIIFQSKKQLFVPR